MTGFFERRFVRVYVIPGAVFQSVMIGGGYGTGREIVEYFTRHGFVGGLLGLLLSLLAIGVVLALTFELARLARAYDYRGFFQALLGRWWFLFEILIVLQAILVIAVLASASGNILRDNFGAPYAVGLAIMLLSIGVLLFYGRDAVARVLTFWSFVLYVVFIAFIVAVFQDHWALPPDTSRAIGAAGAWWKSGIQYALYNVAAAPLLLYVARDFGRRREAVVSGMLGGVIAVVPAVILHVAFFAAYPAIVEQPIPVYWMMGELGMPVLLVVYTIVLFGTFIETGAGMLQGINERFDAWLTERRGRPLGRPMHAAVAMAAILVSAGLAFFGIVGLIARGYGTMAWGFLAVYVLPLLTVGLKRIAAGPRHPADEQRPGLA